METEDRTPSLMEIEPAGDPTLWTEALRPVDESDYLIEKELGRGGMGRVLAAIDVRHGRPVALKLLISASPAAVRRFVREATITARLQHPAIVPVYDTGRFPSGEPFYSMKRVEGGSLEALLPELTTRAARLEVVPRLTTVAEAVAYAHSQRVVHRDLKPANILIGKFGEVLVVDWGLAKHLDDEELAGSLLALADSELMTSVGTVIGTPRYMAPEQARGEPCTAATDVYALGAVLYHVLGGRTPYPGRSTTETLDELRAAPPADLRSVAPDLPADLVAIVRKAMARDPLDRYPTAAELAADLRRFTTGQLVGARQYGPAARAGRWLRRHSRPVLGATALLLAGVAAYGMTRTPRSPSACAGAAGKVAAVWNDGARRSVEAAFRASGRAYAAETFGRVDALLSSYAARYQELHHASCEATARGEQSERLLDAQIACLDRRLHRAGKLALLFAAADADLVERAAAAAGRLEDLESCSRSEAAAVPADPEARRRYEELEARLDGMVALRLAGRFKEARAAGAKLLPDARALGFAPVLAEALYWAAAVEGQLGDPRSSSALLDEGLTAAALARDDVVQSKMQTLRVWMLTEQGRLDDAQVLMPVAEAAALRSDEPFTLSRLWQAKSLLALKRGDAQAALDAAQRALEFRRDAPIDEAELQNSIGNAARKLGRLDVAERASRRAVELYREGLGPSHPNVGGATLNLASVLYHQGHAREAERLIVEVRDQWTRTLGPEHAWLAKVWNNLGEVQQYQGRTADARASLERALAMKEKVNGPAHAETLRTVATLAQVLLADGKPADAEPLARRALAGREKALGPSHPEVGDSLDILANVLAAEGRLPEARAAAERELEIRKSAKANPSGALGILGEIARREGKTEDSIALERESLKAAERPIAVADAKLALGASLLAAGKEGEARGVLGEAAAEFQGLEAVGRAEKARQLASR